MGRGRLLSRESLRTLGRAITSRGPEADWAKGRLLLMVLTLAVLIWAVGGIIELSAADPTRETDSALLVAQGLDKPRQNQEKVTGGNPADERLRNDLFKVAKPKVDNRKKEPKTNPAELLRLLELQGVLGGDNPRAIVFYKRTKETITVSEGDGLGEFEVMEIRERSVILKWREELFELSL